MRSLIICLCAALALPAMGQADVILAARTIRSKSIITEADIVLRQTDTLGSLSQISDVVGLEARVVLYEGRAISASDIGPAAIIERNQLVTIFYSSGELLISAEGRSLGRAGIGDRVKVMNLSSRKIVSGEVNSAGGVTIQPSTFAPLN